MSKSLGNFYTLRDLSHGQNQANKKFSPEALRYFYISNHYRAKLNFTLAGLESAEKTLEGLRAFVKRMKNVDIEKSESDEEVMAKIEETKSKFEEKIAEDLNTPQAIATIFTMINKVNTLDSHGQISKKVAQKIVDFLKKIDEILGVNIVIEDEESEILPEEVEKLIEERQQARKAKNFARADEIRNILANNGIILQDTPKGVSWSIKK